MLVQCRTCKAKDPSLLKIRPCLTSVPNRCFMTCLHLHCSFVLLAEAVAAYGILSHGSARSFVPNCTLVEFILPFVLLTQFANETYNLAIFISDRLKPGEFVLPLLIAWNMLSFFSLQLLSLRRRLTLARASSSTLRVDFHADTC